MVSKIKSEELTRLHDHRSALVQDVVRIDELIVTEKLRLIKHHFGVEVGSIVASTRTDGDYEIASFDLDYSTGNRPWVKAHKRNKNGEWSKSIVWLMDNWEVPK